MYKGDGKYSVFTKVKWEENSTEFAYSNDERRQEQKRLNTIACHCSLPALLLRFSEKRRIQDRS